MRWSGARAKGARAVAFSENPAPLGLPTIHDQDGYWDPVMRAANDAELVVCMHVGLVVDAAADRAGHAALGQPRVGRGAHCGDDARLAVLRATSTRMPNLKIALSEGNIGWIPYFLERAEQVVDKQRHWVTQGMGFAAYDGAHGENRTSLDTFDVRAGSVTTSSGASSTTCTVSRASTPSARTT